MHGNPAVGCQHNAKHPDYDSQGKEKEKGMRSSSVANTFVQALQLHSTVCKKGISRGKATSNAYLKILRTF